MDQLLRPKGRYQIIFAAMALLLICSLVGGVFGTFVLDAFRSEDNGSGGDSTQIDASVEQSFRSTAEADPNNAAAAAALGNYLANTDQLTEAIMWYEKAVAAAPNDPNIRLDFARSLASGTMNGDAELQFQQAIELDPTDPQAHFYLGELYYNMNPQRTTDAIDQYEETIRLDPNSFVAQRSQERLVSLGVATPIASPGIDGT